MEFKEMLEKFLELNDRIEDVLLQIPSVMAGTRDAFDDLVMIREHLRDIRDDVLILLSEVKKGEDDIEQSGEDTGKPPE